jgi:hypothetical protein
MNQKTPPTSLEGDPKNNIDLSLKVTLPAVINDNLLIPARSIDAMARATSP